ncbi:hypothetical protein CBL_03190 [Carabus blaptoides fortunei]
MSAPCHPASIPEPMASNAKCAVQQLASFFLCFRVINSVLKYGQRIHFGVIGSQNEFCSLLSAYRSRKLWRMGRVCTELYDPERFTEVVVDCGSATAGRAKEHVLCYFTAILWPWSSDLADVNYKFSSSN